MLFGVLVIGAVICAVLAVRASRLLEAALWLAGVSVLTAILLYAVGAHMIAVIELSLSVGLITILLVFAISMVGADSPDQPVRRAFNVPLVLAMITLLIGLTIPVLTAQPDTSTEMIGAQVGASFADTFWQVRGADVWVQIALIFTGVLGVLGLLTRTRKTSEISPPLEARRVDEDEAAHQAAHQVMHTPELEREHL